MGPADEIDALHMAERTLEVRDYLSKVVAMSRPFAEADYTRIRQIEDTLRDRMELQERKAVTQRLVDLVTTAGPARIPMTISPDGPPR
jgi:hypothetical protein